MMMKNLFDTILLLALTTTAAFAQNAAIGYPLPNATVSAGKNLTVEIDRPNTLSPSQEVGVAIALSSCASSECFPPDQLLGYILYNGPFKPEYHDTARTKPPHQNFSLPIPSSWTKGPAQLNVAHFTLVGAGAFPYLQTLSTPINIV